MKVIHGWVLAMELDRVSGGQLKSVRYGRRHTGVWIRVTAWVLDSELWSSIRY